MEKATFGAGCFWGVEEAFGKLAGVTATRVGYSGGQTENPTYEQVCSNTTGHVEVVEVEFDPSQTDFKTLVEAFWTIHDPTQVNRQGPDTGTQYRTVIFFHSDAQKQVAEESKAALQNSERFTDDIATQIEPAAKFYEAEEYHQKYFEKNR